jgi:hypothetical protein
MVTSVAFFDQKNLELASGEPTVPFNYGRH